MELTHLKRLQTLQAKYSEIKCCELLRHLPKRKGAGFMGGKWLSQVEDGMGGGGPAPVQTPSLSEAFSDSTDGSDFSSLGSPKPWTSLSVSTGLGQAECCGLGTEWAVLIKKLLR